MDTKSELLNMLGWRVRLATIWQMLCAGAKPCEINQLIKAGLLVETTVLARPIIPLIEPLTLNGWNDPDSLAYMAQGRWTQAPEPTVVYSLSHRAARIMSAKRGKLMQVLQATHDLHVTQIVLIYRQRWPALYRDLISEDYLPRGGKVPDLACVSPTGNIYKYVEFSGSYPASRIRSFIQNAQRKGVDYELW
jgi:hypothetical protein